MSSKKLKVLVADDEVMLAELLSAAFRHEGWEVQCAFDGVNAVDKARGFKPDVAVLDMMMPNLDGVETMKRLRLEADIPVLFLTARDSLEDKVRGLTAGGDDYVVKPFSLEEVVARIKALTRRSHKETSSQEETLRVGDLVLNDDTHEVTKGGREIELTATEFKLLRYLMRNSGRVVSKAQILDHVWNYDFGGQANIVEIYISYLRKKLEDGSAPMLKTLRGVGYILKERS